MSGPVRLGCARGADWASSRWTAAGRCPTRWSTASPLVAAASWALTTAGAELFDFASVRGGPGGRPGARGARPAVPADPVGFLEDAIEECEQTGAVVVGVRPVTDTMKEYDGPRLGATVDRDDLVCVTSPVVLPATVLASLEDLDTDDLAGLVAALSAAVPGAVPAGPVVGQEDRGEADLEVLAGLSRRRSGSSRASARSRSSGKVTFRLPSCWAPRRPRSRRSARGRRPCRCRRTRRPLRRGRRRAGRAHGTPGASARRPGPWWPASRRVGEPRRLEDRDRAAVLGGGVDDELPQLRPCERAGRVVDRDHVDLVVLDLAREHLERLPLRVVPLLPTVDHPEVVGAEVGGDGFGDRVTVLRRTTSTMRCTPATSRTVRTERARIGTPASGQQHLVGLAPADPGARPGGEDDGGGRRVTGGA